MFTIAKKTTMWLSKMRCYFLNQQPQISSVEVLDFYTAVVM